MPRRAAAAQIAGCAGAKAPSLQAPRPAMTAKLPNPPLDTISRVRFAPGSGSTQLLVSSWDAQVSLHDARTMQLSGTHRQSLAVLDCTFLEDASKAVSGGLEKRLLIWDFNSFQETQLGQHDEAIRCVEFNLETRQVYSGSWDRTVRSWDARQPGTPTSVISLGTKAFALDVSANNIVVGGSDRCVHIYDRRKLHSAGVTEPLERRESLLRHQIRALKIGLDPSLYASGSVEGRVGIEHFDPQENEQSRYAFKCHRVKTDGGEDIHPVNAISFHPVHGTFATGGSDGGVCVWDAYAKKRLWRLNPFDTAVSSLSFSADGTMLAIGVSYTFDQGDKNPMPANELVIRQITDSEVLPKSSKR